MFDRSEFLATLAGATGGEMAIAIMEAFSASTDFHWWRFRSRHRSSQC